MAIEIERRFLVDGRKDKPWRSEDSITMTQYYLSDVIHIDDKIFASNIFRNEILHVPPAVLQGRR